MSILIKISISVKNYFYAYFFRRQRYISFAAAHVQRLMCRRTRCGVPVGSNSAKTRNNRECILEANRYKLKCSYDRPTRNIQMRLSCRLTKPYYMNLIFLLRQMLPEILYRNQLQRESVKTKRSIRDVNSGPLIRPFLIQQLASSLLVRKI